MASYMDTADLATFEACDTLSVDYPTPQSLTASSTETEPTKKKRKAWGQPVPPINAILPPRKRAKTAEEKEQRKNERILRNRRAADKSRQRQKAAVADLERRQKDIEAENAQLKQILVQYQSQFGKIPGCEFNPQIAPSSISTSHHTSTSLSLDDDDDDSSHDPDEHQPSSTPVLTMTTPSSIYHESPTLGPTLSLGEPSLYPGSVNISGMTQYPAAVLCDLQCQPDMLTSKLRCMQPSRQLYEVLTLIHCLITWQTSLDKTLSLMSLAFRHLMEIFSATSTQLDYLIQSNFHLIHILISMPATTTQPAVFRLKLLSRLLACNPNLALLLEKAADQALQQTVSQESWTEDADARWAWSSLMTIKWSIRHLEREHSIIRAEITAGTFDNQDHRVRTPGIDHGAVEFTKHLWDETRRGSSGTSSSVDGGDALVDYEHDCISTTNINPTTKNKNINNNNNTTMSDAESRPMNSTTVH